MSNSLRNKLDIAEDLLHQLKEVAEKLDYPNAPSPGAILAMVGYQMFLDKFPLTESHKLSAIKFLEAGYRIAEEHYLIDAEVNQN